MLWDFFQNRLFSVVSFPPLSLPQKRTVELSVQCVQRSASVCTYPYLSRSPWALPSASLQVFSKCSHRVMLEKNHRDTTLSNRAALFIHPKSPSIQARCWRGFPGSHGPGDEAERPRRTSPLPQFFPRHRQPLHPHGALLP